MLEKWDDVIWFGKYKGRTVAEIFTEDIGYLKWLIDETDKTLFPHDMEDMIFESFYESTDYGLYDDLDWSDFNT